MAADGVVKNQRWAIRSSWCHIIITTHTKRLGLHQHIQAQGNARLGFARKRQQVRWWASAPKKQRNEWTRQQKRGASGRASGCRGGTRGLIGRHTDGQRNERGPDFGASGTQVHPNWQPEGLHLLFWKRR